MRERYGVTVRDIFGMSWRSFRTLFETLVTYGILKMNLPGEEDEKFNVIDDWNALAGKGAPQSSGRKTLSEYIDKQGIRRTVLGG